jgi:drug/metabolite transporter (DMT)-like permease
MSESGPATSPLLRSHIVAYVVLCLIWGSTWLAIRVVVQDVPPLKAAAIRFLVGGLLLLGLGLAQRRRWPREGRSWRAILILSATIMAIPYGLLFWAEQHVLSSMAAILFSAMPLMVALLTPVMMGRKVPRNAVFALVVAFGGLLALLFTELRTSRSELLGGAAVMAAMMLSGWSIVYAKKTLQEVDSVVSTGLQLLLGSAALFWGRWALEAHRQAHWSGPSIAALAFLTIFGSCLAFVVYYWLLKRIEPYQLSTTSLIVPIIAVLEGALFYREQVSLTMLVAMAVVLISVGSVLRAETVTERQADILMLRSKTP